MDIPRDHDRMDNLMVFLDAYAEVVSGNSPISNVDTVGLNLDIAF